MPGQFHLAKKASKGKNSKNKNFKTKHKTKDLDQIHDDMKPVNCKKLLNREIDLDLPGGGQFYCVHCAKHFLSENDLQAHYRGKPHKRTLKRLRDEPYSQEEAERAAGMGLYIAPKRIKVLNPEELRDLVDSIPDNDVS